MHAEWKGWYSCFQMHDQLDYLISAGVSQCFLARETILSFALSFPSPAVEVTLMEHTDANKSKPLFGEEYPENFDPDEHLAKKFAGEVLEQRETDKTEAKRPKSAEPLAQRCVHLLANNSVLLFFCWRNRSHHHVNFRLWRRMRHLT